MSRKAFESSLWKLAQVAEDVSSYAPVNLTEDEKIELLAVARRLENIVFHRPTATEHEQATSETSVRKERAA